MSKIKIGGHIKIIPGFPFNSAHFNSDGEGFPLIRIRDLLASKIETFYKGDYSAEFLIDEGDVLIGMDGDFHIVKWKNKRKALLNQRIMKVAQKEGAKINIGYFYYFLFPFPGFDFLPIFSFNAALAAASLAIGTLNGLQETLLSPMRWQNSTEAGSPPCSPQMPMSR